MPREDFLAFPIRLPSLDEQRRIAEVLAALDDLIDSNDLLANRQEDLARLLTLRASESLAPLSELAEISPSQVVKPVGAVDHYSLPAFDNGASPEEVDGAHIKSGKLQLNSNVVLVSRLNPHIARIWAVYPRATRVSVASTEFVPIRGTKVSMEEAYALTSATQYIAQLASRVTGTTGSHQRVEKTALLEFLVPDVRTLGTPVRSAIRDLVSDANAARMMAGTLRRTRDELLPLLMSGVVRVRAA